MLKRAMLLTILLATLMLLSGGAVLADKPISLDAQGNENAWSSTGCTDIKSGLLTDSKGNKIVLGFDQFGYNYQAHLFVGTYDAYNRVIGDNTSDSADDKLIMKWSDSWLSNVDCNGDGKLDRGLVDGDVGGVSLGWLTNQMEGDYDSDGDGSQDAHYTSFTKIVWTGPGSPLWGEYTIIEDILNDPVGGNVGLLTKLGAPGFGLNDQWTTLP